VIASVLVLGTINWHLTVVLLVVISLLGAAIAWLASRGGNCIKASQAMRRT